MYNRDIDGIYYINASLSAPNASTRTGHRPWIAVTGVANSNRINQNVQDNVVMNRNVGRSWNLAASLEKPFANGLFDRRKHERIKRYRRSGFDCFRLIDGTARWRPEQPGPGFLSQLSERIFLATSYRKNYFSFGATGLSLFWEGRTNGNASYAYSPEISTVMVGRATTYSTFRRMCQR